MFGGILMKVGIVSSMHGNQARVYFPDIDTVSAPLTIMQQPCGCIDCNCKWTPNVNDQVLCYIEGERTGYVLGVV